jgi:hypothetical protein
MALVEVTPAALEEYLALPMVIKGRVVEVIARLANWPSVSGAKPLRGALKGTSEFARVIIESSSITRKTPTR